MQQVLEVYKTTFTEYMTLKNTLKPNMFSDVTTRHSDLAIGLLPPTIESIKKFNPQKLFQYSKTFEIINITLKSLPSNLITKEVCKSYIEACGIFVDTLDKKINGDRVREVLKMIKDSLKKLMTVDGVDLTGLKEKFGSIGDVGLSKGNLELVKQIIKLY